MEQVHINMDVENNYYPPEWTNEDIELFEQMQQLYDDDCFGEDL